MFRRMSLMFFPCCVDEVHDPEASPLAGSLKGGSDPDSGAFTPSNTEVELRSKAGPGRSLDIGRWFRTTEGHVRLHQTSSELEWIDLK
jgi:hypothetical protein